MTEVLIVPTSFGDLSEFSHGFADRVEEERIILYGPDAYAEGAQVGFAVLLADDTKAIEGQGIVSAVFDGGDERDPETRYDIVFTQLALAGLSEVVFERIVHARASLAGEEPATGEVDVSQLEEHYDDAEADVASVPPDGMYEEPVAEVEVDDPSPFESVAPEEAAPEEYAEQFEVAAEVGYDDSTVVGEVAGYAPSDAADFEAVDVGDELFAGDDQAAAPAYDGTAVDAGEYEAAETSFETDGGALDVDDAPVQGEDIASYDGEVAFDDDVSVEAMPLDSNDAIYTPDAVAPPQPPGDPGGFDIARSDGPLGRAVFAASWWPVAPPAPEPRPSTGWFIYAAGDLPVPALPPRPDLSPDLRVSPAPSPREVGVAPDPVAAPAQNFEGATAVEAAVGAETAVGVDAMSGLESGFDEAPALEGEFGQPEAFEGEADFEGDGGFEAEPGFEGEAGFEAEPGFEQPFDDDATAHQIPLPDAGESDVAPAVEQDYASVGDVQASEFEELEVDEEPVSIPAEPIDFEDQLIEDDIPV